MHTSPDDNEWKDRVEVARNRPLTQVAAELGYRRDPDDRKKWRRSGSVLSINGTRFFDHRQGKGGGGAIDLVMHAQGTGFLKALELLSASHVSARMPDQTRRHAHLNIPAPAQWHWPEVRRWLIDARRLPPELIDHAHAQGIVFADHRRNAVFIARNVSGKPTGAEIRGTRSGFKGMAPGSVKRNGGFWIARTRNPRTARSLLLTESAIDALSAATCKHLRHVRMFISTAGTTPKIPPWIGELNSPRIFCGFDADDAGDAAAQALARANIPRIRPHNGDKDWNQGLIRRANAGYPKRRDRT